MESYITDPLTKDEEKLIILMQEAGIEEKEANLLLGLWYDLGVTKEVQTALMKMSRHPTRIQILTAGADIVKPLIKRH